MNTQKLSYSEKSRRLFKLTNERILILDGAMGTQIQNLDLSAQDFGGSDLEGCNENLNLTKPKVIQDIHEKYLEAGADIVESNSFGSTPLVLSEYDLASKAYEISKASAQIAKAACSKYTSEQRPRFVAGAVGPTTKAISVTGGVTFNELIENFYIQCKGLWDGGADFILIETAQDTRNVKAALIAVQNLENEIREKIPVAVSGTIETTGTMLAGQSVDALLAAVMHRDLLYLGLNCATGPDFMTDHIRTLSKMAPFPIACVPNAGLPDEDGRYIETPEMIAKTMAQFIEQGWVNFLGGCCGTHEGHIRKLAEIANNKKPRPVPLRKGSWLSGIDFLEITEEMRPVIVGERTNVIGSKKFKNLINDEKYEEAAEVGRSQVKSGAQIIDICLSNPDRVEIIDLERFLDKAIKVIKAPIMIDSTDEKCIELALTYMQGKAIINSINLEDGEERFEKIAPLIKKFGAGVVVGTIDEDPENGMAVTRRRKLEIAERSYQLLTQKYEIPAEDIYFDPLVFPCASGDEKYVGSAVETIEGVRLIKERFPSCKTVLGISNVSFGLPAAGREVLNSVFLYHCVNAGLDLAIVNSEKLERYASLESHDIELANNLIFSISTDKNPDPVSAFANQFRVRAPKAVMDKSLVPLEQRLAKYIVDGTKEGLIDDLKLALEKYKPLEVINGPLMSGMDEVGKLFNDNKLIVAEVLQSAEVMKAAVGFLEPYMEKSETSSRGKMLLATVKGDVHDIGKNLVDIIFSNNGYQVINLGIKVAPEVLIQNAKQHNPDLIGLSGLLVKSAQQMVISAEDLSKAGISVPILVGGAALSRNFTEKRILPSYAGNVFYSQDAMSGLDLANQLMDKEKSAALIQSNNKRKQEVLAAGPLQEIFEKKEPSNNQRSEKIQLLKDLPKAPDYDRHILRKVPVQRLWDLVNPLMLYTRHLGIKAKTAKMLLEPEKYSLKKIQTEDPSGYEIIMTVEDVKKICLDSPSLLSPSGVYQFFRATSSGNRLNLCSDNGDLIHTFEFPRQKNFPYLCLSDYVSAGETIKSPTEMDNVAMFVVTAGSGIRKKAAELKDKGQYLKSHILQALAIETAEGFAEYIHGLIRAQWGYPDSLDMTMMERFQAKYQGKRYSFGYPACPKLEDQAPLFQILKPEEIGVQLTDGFMMDPEASVSAIVFHHPQATYFSVGSDTTETAD